MKILHIDETFHPLFGYHCNPIAKFQRLAGNDVYIIAPESKYIHPVYHEFGEYGVNQKKEDEDYLESTGVKIIRIHGKGYVSGRLVYKKLELYNAIERIKPDVIMVHCIETLTAIRVMRKYRNKFPMVFDSHMLSMASKNKFAKAYEIVYRMVVTNIIKKYDYTVIKTQNDNYVTDHLGIPSSQTRFISFGTDTLLFKPDEDIRKKFKEENNLESDAFIIVSTGKLTKTKGGKLLANSVLKKFNTSRQVAVVVVADFSGSYEKEVKKILDSSENKIMYFPVQKYANLPWFYQIADVTIFPKQCSMSFYDAQSCGSPVISEKENINQERNSHGNGLCFEKDDISNLIQTFEILMNMTNEQYQQMRINSRNFVKDSYSYEQIANEYTVILSQAIEKFNSTKRRKKAND